MFLALLRCETLTIFDKGPWFDQENLISVQETLLAERNSADNYEIGNWIISLYV